MSCFRNRLLEEPDIARKFDLLEAALLARASHRLEMDRSVDAILDAIRRFQNALRGIYEKQTHDWAELAKNLAITTSHASATNFRSSPE